MLAHVFDRFRRVEGTQARTHEGSGIGLALVQELVRLLGGTVAVERRVNHDTTFTVSLPTGSAHLPPDSIAPASPAAAAPTTGVSRQLLKRGRPAGLRCLRGFSSFIVETLGHRQVDPRPAVAARRFAHAVQRTVFL